MLEFLTNVSLKTSWHYLTLNPWDLIPTPCVEHDRGQDGHLDDDNTSSSCDVPSIFIRATIRRRRLISIDKWDFWEQELEISW